VFATLHYGPATTSKLAREHGLSTQGMQAVVRGLHALGLVHRCGWEPTRGMSAALFVAGSGEDAPRPPNRDGSACRHPAFQAKPFTPPAELIAFKSIVEALREEPLSYQDVAEATGVSDGAARNLIKCMREVRIAHIADWEVRLHGGAPAALYAFGFNQPDAPRPRKLSTREIQRRYERRCAARLKQERTLRALHGQGATA
jgi:hypothetical protein